MIIDTHAHLFYDEIVPELNKILDRARQSGITKIIVPAVDLQTSRKVISLCDKYEMIYGAVGFHPCEIKDINPDEIKLIEELTSHPKIIAIGEIGLDFYWDVSYKDKQYFFFKEQIELANAQNLPIIVHTRNSTPEAIEVIKKENNHKLKGQFHCFSGTENDLDNILKIENFYVSFCGNITFKKFDNNNVILKTPIEKLLSETDTPYLSPEPYRGKKNEPSYLIHTLKKLAEIKQIEYNLLIETIYKNCNKLYFTI